jgi:hypothetical protein
VKTEYEKVCLQLPTPPVLEDILLLNHRAKNIVVQASVQHAAVDIVHANDIMVHDINFKVNVFNIDPLLGCWSPILAMSKGRGG